MPKKNWLSDIKARKVSLVPRAANRRTFLLTKSDGGETMDPKILKALLNGEFDDATQAEILKSLETDPDFAAKLSKAVEGLDDKGRAIVSALAKILAPHKDSISRDVVDGLADLVGYDPVKKETKDPAPTGGDSPAGKHPLMKEDGTWDLSGVDEAQRPFFKSVLDAQEKDRIEKEQLQKDLAEEREIRLRKEYVEKAGEFTHLPGIEQEGLADVLKAIKEKAPQVYDTVEKVFGSVQKAMEESELWKERGSGGAGFVGSAEEEINKEAERLVEKDGSLTQAQAVDRVLASRPDLYKKYEAERVAKIPQ